MCIIMRISCLVILIRFIESVVAINTTEDSGEILACVEVVTTVPLETDLFVTVFTLDGTAQGTKFTVFSIMLYVMRSYCPHQTKMMQNTPHSPLSLGLLASLRT